MSSPQFQTEPAGSLPISASRAALLGFVLLGLLFAFPGAIMPAWGYHLRPNYAAVANYFLALNLGLLVAVRLPWPRRKSGQAHSGARPEVRARLTGPCLIAFASLLGLSFTAPPVAEWWRLPGFFGIGVAAGLLNATIFPALSQAYQRSPAATVNLAGLFFGLGCLLASVLVGWTFYAYSAAIVTGIFSIPFAAGAIWFAGRRLPPLPPVRERSARDVAREFSMPTAVLLALLLFLHFGNEWSLAGWLPLFLIERLGISPSKALALLALYWVALAVGRLAVQAVLPRVGHGRLLFGSAAASLFGCVILAFTNNMFGAILGITLVGVGFAPIYPLVVEKIGSRFPHYHPGLFNGIFSLALTGGLLAPACVGYASEFAGVRVLIAFPMAGTVLVLLLVILIWIDTKWGARAI